MKDKESAVSPVIGVMLMLVVTLIIAAVVSGFAGGLAGSNAEKAPTLTMDIQIKNTGSWMGSGFSAAVTGVSEPINTQDLKLITKWRSTSGTAGGNTTVGDVYNFACIVGMGTSGTYSTSVAPYGFGSGVSGDVNPTKPFTYAAQQFGNYTLTTGTTMSAIPFGTTSGAAIGGTGSSATSGYGVVTPYTYTLGDYTSSMTDAMQAVLGRNWETMRAGDMVSVSVVHIPSGKTIFDRDVAVLGA